ncbi:MAG: hypothetical protein ABI472_08405 [Ginsengibacter sp.]
MYYFKKFWILLVILMAGSKGVSQIFGGTPPSLRWKQINTPLARIIFPAGLDFTAERVSNIILFMNGPMQYTIGKKFKKINLVLQNQTTVSNGYVGLGPFRSEFLITPLQNSFELGSLSWPDQLTIHEYRHVQQYNNFNVGLSKLFYDLFGDEGQALVNNAAIPNWFYEGDAVYNETNVSKQGRGSLPFFYNGYRSLWKEGKQYSWMKLRNGSYKDFVPNHYPLGYLLVAYGREKYGDTFWENVTHDAASFKGLLYPFQRAIKKYSGEDYVTFRNGAFNFFKKEFNPENTCAINSTKSQTYLDETYPAYIGNDSIIFVKSGYRQIPEFVLRTGNKDEKIRIRDYSFDGQFSYKNGKIIYASYRPDVRWGYRDYSDLRILDVASGKQQMLTNHTKYFSPDINESGKKVIAVYEATNTACALHVLNAVSGEIVKIISNPDRLFYTYPKFYNDDKIISAVRNSSGEMALAVIDINNDETKYLTPFTYSVIGFPYVQDDTIYFSYSYQKNDELFAYTFSNEKLWRINYSAGEEGIGRYQPSVNDGHIVWSAFTAEGYRLKEVAKNQVQFKEVKTAYFDKNTSGFGITALQKTNSNLLYRVPNDSFSVTKYSKGFKLFNFHSIEPAADDPQYTLKLLGENILNTFQSQLAFTYDRAEKFKTLGYSATYGGWFPFLSAGVNYTFDRRTLYHGKQADFNELEPFAGFNIPLNLSKGRSFTYINLGSQYVYNQSNFKGAHKDTLGKIAYSYISSFASFSHQVQKTLQQIFPKFAQTIRITYKAPVSHYNGFQFVANGNLYLPGFLKNHSIIVNGAYLKKDSIGEINFSSGFPFSRGYSSINLYEMYKWGIDYHLPLLYPDAGFGNIFYLLRVRTNLFYDHTKANHFYTNGNKFTATFRSMGAEITFDTRWWNEASISAGVRYTRLLDNDIFGTNGRNRWEIILPVNIFNQ